MSTIPGHTHGTSQGAASPATLVWGHPNVKDGDQ